MQIREVLEFKKSQMLCPATVVDEMGPRLILGNYVTSPITISGSNGDLYTLPLDTETYNTNAYNAPADWHNAYSRQLRKYATQAAEWVVDHRDTYDVDTQWHNAQAAAHQEALLHVYQAIRLQEMATGTTSAITINATTSGSATTANFLLNTGGTTWATVMEDLCYNKYLRPPKEKTPEELLKERQEAFRAKVQRGLTPTIKSSRSNRSSDLFSDCSPAEIAALHLLRKMVAPEEFKRYLRYGHINIRGGLSGLTYQVCRQSTIKVWERGETVASLCVHLNHSAPPTDHVVGKLLIIECDEADIWKRSNISWYTNKLDRESLKAIGQASSRRGGVYLGGGNNLAQLFVNGPVRELINGVLFDRAVA